MNEMDRCMKCMCEQEEGRFCTQCGYDREGRNPERALPVGSVLENKYLIGAVIGEGGFGITYAAWDMLIKTGVAIKEYFPSELVTRDAALAEGNSALDLTLIQGSAGESRYRKELGRFVEGAKNLAKFQRHPGVVSVKNFFYANNTAYMVMEYIKGITLGTYLKNHGDKLDVEETFRMMEPVMKTLRAIHQEGVIHRDISPDNIMVTEDGQLKLIDFGAARFVGTDDEKSLTVILKHGYAPEEQYRSGGEQGPWTDVYALSAVIYRMLTGKAPEETFKRMSEKGDSVHEGLKKVPGLSKAAGHALEKGLAVKAEKRFRTMAALYEGIYSGKKRGIWKWGVCAAVLTLVSTAALCFAVFGMAGMNKDSEETFAEEEDVREETDDSELMYEDDTDGVADEGGETEEEEELQEPENIRALREYYNANCLGQKGNVYFADLTGDREIEMIVLETDNMAAEPSLWGKQKLSLAVYQFADGNIKEIYYTDVEKEMSGEMLSATGVNYYLFVKDGKAGILVEHCGESMEEVSFENIDEDSIELIAIPQEEFRGKRKHGILLLDSFTMMTPSWNMKEELEDYQSVLKCMEEMTDLIKITEASEKTVLDYSVIYDGDEKCILVIAGEIRSDQVNGDCLPMEYYEGQISLWASYNGQVKKVEEGNFTTDGYWMGSEIYQFGRNQHYFLLTGCGGAHYIYYEQHKFCFEDGHVYKIDSNHELEKDENGKVQVKFYHNVEELNGNILIDDSGMEVYEEETIDIFFYDHQYVEYGAEIVENNDLEKYENYNEVIQTIEETFKESCFGIGGGPAYLYGSLGYYVMETEMDHIRKSVNNIYYLNYKTYGRRRSVWIQPSQFFDQYSEE